MQGAGFRVQGRTRPWREHLWGAETPSRAKSGVIVSYRGPSLTGKSAPLGTYSRNVPRAQWWSWGGGFPPVLAPLLVGSALHIHNMAENIIVSNIISQFALG